MRVSWAAGKPVEIVNAIYKYVYAKGAVGAESPGLNVVA